MSWVRTNIPGYVKDTRTGSIINTNVGEYQTVRTARRKKIEMEAMRENIVRLEKLLERSLSRDGS